MDSLRVKFEIHELTNYGISEVKRLFDLWYNIKGHHNDYYDQIRKLDQFRKEDISIQIAYVRTSTNPILLINDIKDLLPIKKIQWLINTITITYSDGFSIDERIRPIVELDRYSILNLSITNQTLSCSQLMRFPNLQKLSIRNVKYCNSLSIPNQIRELYIDNCDAPVVTDLVDYISRNLNVRTLSISSQDIYTLSNLPTTLITLKLNNCSLRVEQFKVCTKLEELDISGSNIDCNDPLYLLNLHVFIGSNIIPINNLDAIFVSMNNLTTIDLGSNSISTINKEVFDCPNLISISLQFNLIEELPPGIFDKCTNLEYLYLSNNKIREIQANTFHTLNCLYEIDLGSNIIESLNSDVFKKCPNLGVINLEYNMMTTLPDTIFEGLVNLGRVDLNDNDGLVLSEYMILNDYLRVVGNSIVEVGQ